MKIAIITSGNYFSSYGGGQIYVKNIISKMKDSNNEIYIISIMNNFENKKHYIKKIKKDKNTYIIQLYTYIKYENSTLSFELQPQFLNIIKNLLQEISPNIVHANGWKISFSYICKQLNIPCIVTIHHAGIVCPNGMLMYKDKTICNKKINIENCLDCTLNFVPGGKVLEKGVKKIPYFFLKYIGKSLKKIPNIPYITPTFITAAFLTNKFIENEILKKNVDIFIVPSNAMAKVLFNNDFPKEKIKIVPHGIEPLKKTVNIINEKIKFGYVGRISYIKGIHLIVEILKKMNDKNYEFHIFGEAVTKQEKRYLSKLLKESKNLPIYWHGKIPHSEIEKAYYSFNVMILPTIGMEVFGLTVLESLSAGRPVIASKCGGPEDLIKDGENGMLFESNSIENLVYVLNKINKQFLESMSANAFLEKKFFLDSHVENLLRIYEDLIKRNNR